MQLKLYYSWGVSMVIQDRIVAPRTSSLRFFRHTCAFWSISMSYFCPTMSPQLSYETGLLMSQMFNFVVFVWHFFWKLFCLIWWDSKRRSHLLFWGLLLFFSSYPYFFLEYLVYTVMSYWAVIPTAQVFWIFLRYLRWFWRIFIKTFCTPL